MLHRLAVSLTLALFASIAATGVASAAVLSDRDDVMIATGATVLGSMAFFAGVYLIKQALGLYRPPPPDTGGPEGHH